MVKDLWVEKYRPKKIVDYVFCSGSQRAQIQEWVNEGAIPHILLSGTQGIGKTTLAKVLLHELDVNPADILELNASSDNGVEVLRKKITGFAETMPYGDFRYVLLDEADYLTINAQAILRGVLEKYSATTRFILTCNYPHKIIPAIHSRMQSFDLTKLDLEEFKMRALTVLVAEEVDCSEDIVDTYIRATYPDLRKCLGMMQQNTLDGVLGLPDSSSSSGQTDYWISMVDLFKSNKINEARKLICSQARVEEFDNIYRFLYENLEFWGDENKQEKAIIIIRDGLVNHAIVADPEINLSAVLITLSDLVNS